MKNKFTALLLLLFVSGTAFNQLHAQCPCLLGVKPTTSWEITNYDKKNKAESINSYTVKNYDPVNCVVTLNVVSTGNGTSNEVQEFTMSCVDGELQMDMSMLLGDMSKFGGSGMGGNQVQTTTKVTGDALSMPSNLSVGQKLKDGSLRVEITMDGIVAITSVVNMKFVNRRVTAQENVTVPIGTFQAFLIDYDMEMTTETMGMKMNMNMASKLWVDATHFMLRSEIYDAKGKLMGSSALTKWNN